MLAVTADAIVQSHMPSIAVAADAAAKEKKDPVATLGNLRVFISRDAGKSWTHAIPLDTSSYGNPGGLLLDDESILISYTQRGAAPTCLYVIRFKVSDNRDGIQILPVGG